MYYGKNKVYDYDYDYTVQKIISEFISIKNVKKKFFYSFIFGVPGGRNHPPSYHYKYIPIYLLNKIRRKIIEWAENGP